MHGQSISLIGQGTKGSVSVFLSSDEDEDEVWALTAYHVVPFFSTNETRVITPGGLDVLTRLLHLGVKATHEADISFLLDRWETPCGYVQYGHIGTNSNGWRSQSSPRHRVSFGWSDPGPHPSCHGWPRNLVVR
jgi:hypothetical protein